MVQSFSSAASLTSAIARGLRQYETLSQAISADDFEEKLKGPIDALSENWNSDPELILAVLPQPERMINIMELESTMDDLFTTSCEAGLARLRDGYEVIKESRWTGLKSGGMRIAKFADGMIILTANPVLPNQGSFSQFFAPPGEIERVTKGFRRLLEPGSGFVHLRLRNMGSTYVAQHPDGNSVSMRSSSASESRFSRLFTPITAGSYEDWVGHSMSQLCREYGYPAG